MVIAADRNLSRAKNAAKNLTWLRRVALSLHKQTPPDPRNRSLKGRRREATRSDDDFLATVRGNPQIP